MDSDSLYQDEEVLAVFAELVSANPSPDCVTGKRGHEHAAIGCARIVREEEEGGGGKEGGGGGGGGGKEGGGGGGGGGKEGDGTRPEIRASPGRQAHLSHTDADADALLCGLPARP